MAEYDIPYGVPELKYVEVDRGLLSRMRASIDDWWGDQTPIALCSRCGRYTEDPNRDSEGDPINENPEDDREVVCLECLEKAYFDSRKRDIEEIIDERLDLGEKDRESLKRVVELVVTDPDKVLALKDMGNRVRSLEKQTNYLWMVFIGAIIVLLIGLAGLVVSVVVGT